LYTRWRFQIHEAANKRRPHVLTIRHVIFGLTTFGFDDLTLKMGKVKKCKREEQLARKREREKKYRENIKND
ncbi:unnamed protein product, partial [Larinioides sclopetarius]